jgi:catechol O-methyltransferase
MRKDTRDPLLDHVRANAPENDPDAVIDAIDAYSRANGGMMHLGRSKGAIFDDLVRRSGARLMLELGTNYGYSALRAARALGDGASIHTVEADRRLAEIASAIIAHAGLDDRISVSCGKSNDIIRKFNTPFDLVFIDHGKDDYLADLHLIEQLGLMKIGTTVITDNVVIFERQLWRYLDHVRNSGHYESSLHRPSSGADGLERSIRLTAAGP